MFKVVFLDDDELRFELLKRLLKEARIFGEMPSLDITWFKHVSELDRASLAEADYAFFDHDMCQAPLSEHCPRGKLHFDGKTYTCGCPTGKDLVLSIIDPEGVMHLTPKEAPRIIVHSANSVGAHRMISDLTHYGYDALRVDFSTWRSWENPLDLWAYFVTGA